uniref:Enolase-phosphatase E1 n=1 Tax=Meloidogyne incognita TaxID=6306 RepID=A0A914MWF4_MELIC
MNNPSFEAILTDVEGTTTSIDFVKNVLFPFSFEHAGNFIQKLVVEKREPEHQKILDDLIKTSNEYGKESSEILVIQSNDKSETQISKLTSNVLLWIKQDKKYTALKNLQGLIWEDGYKNGLIKAHVYPDVPFAFERLNEAGINIHIFSSGSIKAQKLLYSHTEYGNLEKFISSHFDTTIGPKFEKESYQRIVEQIGIAPNKILFLTDIENEAFAAKAASLHVRLALRPGNAALSESALKEFKTFSSFEEII